MLLGAATHAWLPADPLEASPLYRAYDGIASIFLKLLKLIVIADRRPNCRDVRRLRRRSTSDRAHRPSLQAGVLGRGSDARLFARCGTPFGTELPSTIGTSGALQ